MGLEAAKAAGGAEAPVHPELKEIAALLQRIGQTLEVGKESGQIKPDQLRSMARDFEGIAKALEKGAMTSRR